MSPTRRRRGRGIPAVKTVQSRKKDSSPIATYALLKRDEAVRFARVLLQAAETTLPYVDIYIHHGGARPVKGKGIYGGGYVYSTARAGRGR
jgi:hypothetical protein